MIFGNKSSEREEDYSSQNSTFARAENNGSNDSGNSSTISGFPAPEVFWLFSTRTSSEGLNADQLNMSDSNSTSLLGEIKTQVTKKKR